MRTITGISHLLKPIDDAIDTFIQVLSQGYSFNPAERILFSLPANYGGMEYKNSRDITKKTSNKVMRNEIQFQDNRVSTGKIKNNIKNQKKKLSDAKLQEVMNNTSCKTKLRSIKASMENGACIWLSDTNKEKWFLSEETSLLFNFQHALSFPKGGLVITRHKELRNLTDEILGKVCKNVVIEPLLTPLIGEEFPNLQMRATKQEQMCQLGGYGLTGKRPFVT